MTCIVGFINKDTVYMGGDSSGVADNEVKVRKDPKVFKVGPFVIGFCGSYRLGQLLRSSKFIIPKQKPTQIDEDYMITEFVDAVKSLFTNSDAIFDNNSGFLVGYRGKLYGVYDDYQIEEVVGNYNAMGAGEQYAKGALDTLELFETDLKPEEIVGYSLQTSEKFCPAVLGPMILVKMSKKESINNSK